MFRCKTSASLKCLVSLPEARRAWVWVYNKNQAQEHMRPLWSFQQARNGNRMAASTCGRSVRDQFRGQNIITAA